MNRVATAAVEPVRARLRCAGLTKRYGVQLALHDADFAVAGGEIVAVVGENGAGKSTLSKIISGAVTPDHGTLQIDGTDVTFGSPRDAIDAGVSYIPQELSYVPEMTVAENLLLARWPSRRGLTTTRAIVSEARRIAVEFGIDLDMNRKLVDIPIAERQLVEILKCLAREMKVLILDEPTAALTADESAILFRVLRRLKQTGVGIVFVSHRLDEIFEIADRIVVLRDGRVVADVPPASVSTSELIELMLGADVAEAELNSAPGASHSLEGRPAALSIRNWTRDGLPPVQDLSFDVKEGEIVVLFGQRGSGADLVADGIAGRIDGFEGSLHVLGSVSPVFTHPRLAMRAGIGYVPPERKRDGLRLESTICENITLSVLSSVSRFGVVNRSEQRREATDWSRRLQVRAVSIDQEVGFLSGGNQQKVLLGSKLIQRPKILVLNDPTRGVDVGARAEIHRLLRAEAASGTAVLWVTTDVEEATLIADRLLVFREGSVVGELVATQLEQKTALALATGESI